MKSLKTILCALLLALTLCSTAVAGDITGPTFAKPGDITGVAKPGDITGAKAPGDITGILGDITGIWGDITGIIGGILGGLR